MLPSVDYALFVAKNSSHQVHMIAPGGSPTYTRIHYSTGISSFAAHRSDPSRPAASLIYACEPARAMVLNIDGQVSAQRHLSITIVLPSDAADAQAEFPNGQHRWEETS
jgi:hypothetical protein